MYTMVQDINRMVQNAAELQKEYKEKCNQITAEILKIRQEKAQHICEFLQEYSDCITKNKAIIPCDSFKFTVTDDPHKTYLVLTTMDIRVVNTYESQSLKDIREGCALPKPVAVTAIDAWDADKEDKFKGCFLTYMVDLVNEFKQSEQDALNYYENLLRRVKGE